MTITLTNPTDSTQTWTSGKRGRVPTWVATHPEYMQFKGKEVLSAHADKTPEDEYEPQANLKFWKWSGNHSALAIEKCYVAAETPEEAVLELNKAFINPIGKSEFAKMWTEVEQDENLGRGVFKFDTDKKTWIKKVK